MFRIISLLLLTISLTQGIPTFAYTNGCATDESKTQDQTFGCKQSDTVITSPWILTDFNQNHKNWLAKFDQGINSNKTPYFTMYMIAGSARRDWGLQDCNVGTPNLCQRGADYIRQNMQRITDLYGDVTWQMKKELKGKPVYIHVEPDFYQYVSSQNPLSYSEGIYLLNMIIGTIHNNLPQAVIVQDVASWADSKWLNQSRSISYINQCGIVGKWLDPSGVDGRSYNQLSEQCGHNLVVNTAHGVGGQFNNYNYSWLGNTNPVVDMVIQAPR